MKTLCLFFLLFISSFTSLPAESMSALLLPSTESDPDAFINNSCNVINGDYSESAIDLMIAGPDALILQRYYNNKNYMTGEGPGGWRIFPQTFLVLGKDPKGKECTVRNEHFEWVYAYTGERSGGILAYSGWKRVDGDTKDPLKINPLKDSAGMVNTYSGEMNGQTNHLNNRIDCKNGSCELTLGDGTKRLYKQIKKLPNELFGEELFSTLANKVGVPQYFQLVSEILPSGNTIHFSYDEKGHLASIEMQNAAGEKTHSWIKFAYHFHNKGCSVSLTSSDEKRLTYEFERFQIGKNSHFALNSVQGSHFLPISYQYTIKGNRCLLTKKTFPEGRFLEIDYDNQGRVKTLKSPDAKSSHPTILYDFSYGDTFTDVTNAAKIKTRYRYDTRLQLIAIERYDQKGKLYKTDQKHYRKTKSDSTLLVARTIADGQGHILSYRSFEYDKRGNVVEERLYGNLTGEKEISLQVEAKGQLLNPDEEECHIKKFTYSEDGFNLLTSLGDCKGNQTTYHYEKGSNRLSKKLIYDGNRIKKREFRFYNTDAVCIKIIEDNNSHEDVNKVDGWGGSQRYITETYPKENLPGVGLPEIIEEKALNIREKKEILIKKLINTYSPQGNLLSCETYDANGVYAYTVSKTYNHFGQIVSETDPEGKILSYSYDEIGNQIFVSIPHQQKTIETRYDYRNNPIQIIETAGNLQAVEQHFYDVLDRKITSIDRFGQRIRYDYDDFGRLTQVVHPTVLDEYKRPIQPIFSYTYDIFGNALSVTDPKGYTTKKEYNLRGEPSKIYYPDGSFEFFKYDTEGSLYRSLTRDRIITVYEYDYLGRVVHEEVSTEGEKGVESHLKSREYEYNAFRILEEKDGYSVTELKYAPTGKAIEILYKDSRKINESEVRKTEIIYDSLGKEAKKKAWFDIGPSDYSLECLEYDLLGNVTEKRIEDANQNILLLKNFVYDDSGRCIEESSFQNGEKQTLLKTTYNLFGDPIAYNDGLGNTTNIIIDYGQDALTKTLINPLGIQTILQFDALGRIASTTKKDAKDKLLSSQEILYDGLGNKSAEIHAVIVDGRQIGILKTRWIYGPMSRLEQLIEAEGSPEERSTVNTYNEIGRLVSKHLPGADSALHFTYSKEGWVSKIEYSENKKILLSNTFFHDERGNITFASTQDGKKVRRSYNVFDQITVESVEDGEGKYTLKFQYDRKGRLKSIVLPDLSSIAYTYDAVFGREVMRIVPNGEELYSHTYNTYDLIGKLTDETLIGYCGDCKTLYDQDGRTISVKTDYHTEIVPGRGYSALGHLLTIQREGDFPLENGKYAYNDLSKLVSEKNGVHKTYCYDSLDNRLNEDQEKLLYNSLNQLIAKSNTRYAYDPQGNLLRKTLEGEETHFESNILSQLIGIKKPDGTTLNFSYDPFGRRLVKKSSRASNSSRSFYLGHHELGTLDKKGTIQKLRIPGISGDAISLKSVAIEINDQAYAVLHDISGNVCALLDPDTREVVESYTYTAFGQEKIYNAFHDLVAFSEVGNPWRYAEKPIDEETGLINFGLRYYDPTIGRWTSQDPAGYLEGPNLYAYCNNNPLNVFDRFGLFSERDSLALFWCGPGENKSRVGKSGGDLDKTDNSQLPKIIYCESWEQMYPQYDVSKTYDLGLQEVKNIGIGFINGVWNDFESSYKNAQYISELAGGYNIHGVFNATHGKHPDVKECRIGLKYIATEPVLQLHKMWNSFFERSSSRSKFLMICHSQGAIHVRNALLDYPSELRDRIMVVAIAPAAYIYKETCAHVIHYRVNSKLRDPVPYVFDSKGAQREQYSVVNLQPHPDTNIFDHYFNSPTYVAVIKKRIESYINGGIL